MMQTKLANYIRYIYGDLDACAKDLQIGKQTLVYKIAGKRPFSNAEAFYLASRLDLSLERFTELLEESANGN